MWSPPTRRNTPTTTHCVLCAALGALLWPGPHGVNASCVAPTPCHLDSSPLASLAGCQLPFEWMLLRSALRTFKPLVPRAPCVDTLRKSWRFTRGMSTANAEAQSMDGSAEALPDKVEKPKKRAARRKAEPEAKADETDAASPEAEAKPKAKRAKKNPLPKEPVGVRYEESMRPQRLEGSGQTFMSWNVAGAPQRAAPLLSTKCPSPYPE